VRCTARIKYARLPLKTLKLAIHSYFFKKKSRLINVAGLLFLQVIYNGKEKEETGKKERAQTQIS